MSELPPIVPHTSKTRNEVLLRYVGVFVATWVAVLLVAWIRYR